METITKTEALNPMASPRRVRSIDPRMGAALAGVVVVGLLETALTIASYGRSTAVSVGVGAFVAALNLYALNRVAGSFLEADGRSAPWAALGGVKLLALIGAFYVLLKYEIVAPFPLMIGYGALPIGATVGFLCSKAPPDDPST